MTTAEAIVIASVIYVGGQVVLSLLLWFVAFPWQRRWDKRNKDPNPWYREPTDEEIKMAAAKKEA